MADGFDGIYVDTRRQLRGVAESLIAGRNTARRAPSGSQYAPTASLGSASRSPCTAPSWFYRTGASRSMVR
ncbi:MAG: hypothetical protein QOK45_2215 [Mycobacterium sp.]|jgi:hypothetical protein|nr:hypothetical protein [Mycobacterium sp.]